MDPEAQAKFDSIDVILNRMAADGEAAQRRFNECMDRAERRAELADKRMDRFEKRMELAEKRMELAEKRSQLFEQRMDQRMEKFDHQLQTTRKLVEAGIKLVSRLATDTRELKRSQKAFLDSFKNGRNGHSRS